MRMATEQNTIIEDGRVKKLYMIKYAVNKSFCTIVCTLMFYIIRVSSPEC